MNAFSMVLAVKNCLDQLNVNYDYDDDHNVITLMSKVESKINNVRYFIPFGQEDYIVYVTCPMNADEESRGELLRYFAMINYDLISGGFEMDVNDGEIRYKYYVDCRDLDELPQIIVARSLIIPVNMYEQFGDGIAALLMGFSDADTEYKKARQKGSR